MHDEVIKGQKPCHVLDHGVKTGFRELPSNRIAGFLVTWQTLYQVNMFERVRDGNVACPPSL
eukprot:5718936-Karenia_brevis.AAC.1